MKTQLDSAYNAFLKQKRTSKRKSSDFNGGPGRIRTCDLLIRSQTLYPTELRSRYCLLQATMIL